MDNGGHIPYITTCGKLGGNGGKSPPPIHTLNDWGAAHLTLMIVVVKHLFLYKIILVFFEMK